MGRRGPPQIFDRSMIKRLRRNGWTVKRVAIQLECSIETVKIGQRCTLPALREDETF